MKLFDFQQVDDPALKKFEEKSNEKTAAAHTKGILMALSAGALYGIQVIFAPNFSKKRTGQRLAVLYYY